VVVYVAPVEFPSTVHNILFCAIAQNLVCLHEISVPAVASVFNQKEKVMAEPNVTEGDTT